MDSGSVGVWNWGLGLGLWVLVDEEVEEKG